MLLLVPSSKTDDDSKDDGSTGSKKVLVLLPSDIDLSSKVVVPDTAITNILGADNTSLGNFSNLLVKPRSSQESAFLDISRSSRDDLGILQPLRPIDQPYSTQSTLKSPSQVLNRACRHSYTGVGESGCGTQLRSHQHLSSRQLLLHGYPCQYQPTITSRALRAAFRKARKDQSPLLTSTSFGTNYIIPDLFNDSEDSELPTSLGRYHNPSQTPDSVTEEMFKTTISPRSAIEFGTRLGKVDKAAGGNIDSNDNGDISTYNLNTRTHRKGLSIAVGTTAEHQTRKPSELVDKDDIHNKGMHANSKPETFESGDTHTSPGPPESVKEIGPELDSALDVDMTAILGMASDSELVIPEFDDDYLKDSKNDLPQFETSRSPVSTMAASSSCSYPLSATIAYVPNYTSPKSYSETSCLTSKDNDDDDRTDPQIQPQPITINMSDNPSGSGEQALSTSQVDMENLKRHRESLKQMSESTAQSEESLASSKHIYFKPTYHTLPQRGTSGHSYQAVMPTHCSQWGYSTNANSPTAASTNPLQYFPWQSVMGGNEGNHIFRTQEPLASIPSPILNKRMAMTVSNISKITANMSVQTPQEIQECYYARKNLRIRQRRRRRRDSTTVGISNNSGYSFQHGQFGHSNYGSSVSSSSSNKFP
ncbi:hypothetical protein BX616_011031 [Lobosporangium transversale]|nr:hypothetical protein BX616_011031 [Lobosporangium transversale]